MPASSHDSHQNVYSLPGKVVPSVSKAETAIKRPGVWKLADVPLFTIKQPLRNLTVTGVGQHQRAKSLPHGSRVDETPENGDKIMKNHVIEEK
jgi:hypothetical protein